MEQGQIKAVEADPPQTTNRLKNLINKKLLDVRMQHLRHITELLGRQQARTEQEDQQEQSALAPRAIFHRLYRNNLGRGSSNDLAVLEKLSPFDFRAARKQLLAGYTEVRNWFFESQQYLHWCQGRPWQLHCYGEPRSGKTTFAAAVAAEVEKTTDEHTAVVSLYLQRTNNRGLHLFNVPSMSATEAVLPTRLALGLRSDVLEDWKSSGTSTIDASLADIRTHLHAEAAKFKRVFLIVDGLDFLPEAVQESLVAELAGFLKESLGILRLMLVQSRTHWAELEALKIKCDRSDCDRDETIVLYWQCPHCNDGDFHLCQACYDEDHHCRDRDHELREPYDSIEVELQTPQAELVNYVQIRLQEEIRNSSSLGRRLSDAEETVESIKDTIAAKAAGVFVLAKLYVGKEMIDYLHKKQSLDEVLDVLDRLPQHEVKYFDTLMLEVTDQDDKIDRFLALSTLAVVATASQEARPLSFHELTGALQHLPGKGGASYEGRLTEMTILRITRGFLTIGVSYTARVQPFHETVGIYLYENCKPALSKVRLDMTSICCGALTNAATDSARHADDVGALLRILESRPFLYYALQHWGSHVRHSDWSSAYESTYRFLQLYQHTPALKQANILATGRDQGSKWCGGSDKLHLCAAFGLTKLLCHYVETEPDLDVNVLDKWSGWTPLMIAVRLGHLTFVQKLLEAGSDIDITGPRGETALQQAVFNGDLFLLQALLARYSAKALNAPCGNSDGETAYMLAIRLRREELTETFTRKSDLAITAQNIHGRTALHIAAEVGSATVVRQLTGRMDFERLVNVSETLLGRSAPMILLESANWNDESIPENNRLSIMKKLHQSGADISHADALGRTLLHYAALDDEFVTITAYLLDQGLNVDAKDHRGWTALHCAALGGFCGPETVRTLLKAGADRSIKNKDGMIPSDIAALYRQSEIGHMLDITTGGPSSSSGATARLWQTILHDSSVYTAEELSQVSSEELTERNPLGYTVLHCAIEAGNLAVLQALLEDGRVSGSIMNAAGLTALLLAIIQLGSDIADAEDLVTALLDGYVDLDIDRCDGDGHTALYLAIQGNYWAIAIRLVNRHARLSVSHEKVQRLFHECVRTNEPQAMGVLLDAGARVLQRDSMGKLPSQLAEDHGASAKLLASLHEAETNAIKGLASD
ncbi:hypothetical protein LTR10_001372 [Elasticomyces elasticus]|nr:hypothetical protein LTR10_001372 [Elasticomyces elasticus]KAK4974873.1 hypothetical protein LTR42_004082 [Elasticomyces elasticus]